MGFQLDNVKVRELFDARALLARLAEKLEISSDLDLRSDPVSQVRSLALACLGVDAVVLSPIYPSERGEGERGGDDELTRLRREVTWADRETRGMQDELRLAKAALDVAEEENARLQAQLDQLRPPVKRERVNPSALTIRQTNRIAEQPGADGLLWMLQNRRLGKRWLLDYRDRVLNWLSAPGTVFPLTWQQCARVSLHQARLRARKAGTTLGEQDKWDLRRAVYDEASG